MHETCTGNKRRSWRKLKQTIRKSSEKIEEFCTEMPPGRCAKTGNRYSYECVCSRASLCKNFSTQSYLFTWAKTWTAMKKASEFCFLHKMRKKQRSSANGLRAFFPHQNSMVWEDAALSKRHLLPFAIVKKKVVSHYLAQKNRDDISTSLRHSGFDELRRWVNVTNKQIPRGNSFHRKLENGNCNNHLYIKREMMAIEHTPRHHPPSTAYDSRETFISMQTKVP